MVPTTNLLAFALALIVAAGTPGPSVAALVARVLTGGFRSVFPFLLAMWIGEVIWLTVAVTGLAALARWGIRRS
jgi:threonine/homoserine/homoserine lactone efflux protein